MIGESFCIEHFLVTVVFFFFSPVLFWCYGNVASNFEPGFVCLFRGYFTELVPYLNC